MNSQQGITLIEVAISVAIAGVLMAGALVLYSRAEQQRQFETTYDNIDTIVQALSAYVETTGRIPCPADPAATYETAGWERGTTPTGTADAEGYFPAGSCDGKTREGIVPYNTLSLPVKTAMDGWGHFYTYAVSPVFTRPNDQSSLAADTGRIHGRCRHRGWVKPTDQYSRNAIKARFCCADQADPPFDVDTDLIILHRAGGAALSPARTPGIKSNYDDLGKTTTNFIDGAAVPVFDSTPVEAPAFVLVSHGPDRKGAWLANGTGNRLDPPDSGPELNNADADQVFVDGPWNLKPGPEYFDDIVRWMTQDGIMAAHGALSCAYP